MTSDPLKELLARADAASPPPAARGDIAERVRRRARRRDRVRAGAAALLLVAAFGAIAAIVARSRPASEATALIPDRTAQIRAELAELDSQAKVHRQTADALRRSAARATWSRAEVDWVLRSDPAARINEARDRAALIIVRQAERGDEPGTANEAYRRAAQLFPDTPAGHLAAERLKAQNPST